MTMHARNPITRAPFLPFGLKEGQPVMATLDGIRMRYRLFREADTWIVGVTMYDHEPEERTRFHEFASHRKAMCWATSDYRRRQVLRRVA